MGEKEKWAIGIGLILIIGFTVWGVMDSRNVEDDTVMSDSDIIYYYGEECPHCKDVAKYLEENSVADKVDFEKKEVWNNSANNAEMLKRADSCGIEKSELGVPFLWAREECMIGAPKIEAFFDAEMALVSDTAGEDGGEVIVQDEGQIGDQGEIQVELDEGVGVMEAEVVQ